MDKHTTLNCNFAGFGVRLRVPHHTSSALNEELRHFLWSGSPHVTIEATGDYPALHGSSRTIRAAQNHEEITLEDAMTFKVVHRDRHAQLHFVEGPGVDPIIGILAALQTLVASLLPAHDALVLHSSAVSLNGDGVMFVGKSGAGKSTLHGMFHADEQFADELNFAMRSGHQWNVLCAPFKSPRPQTARTAPLKKIFVPVKGSTCQTRRLPPNEAFRALVRCIAIRKDSTAWKVKRLSLHRPWPTMFPARSSRFRWIQR